MLLTGLMILCRKFIKSTSYCFLPTLCPNRSCANGFCWSFTWDSSTIPPCPAERPSQPVSMSRLTSGSTHRSSLNSFCFYQQNEGLGEDERMIVRQKASAHETAPAWEAIVLASSAVYLVHELLQTPCGTTKIEEPLRNCLSAEKPINTHCSEEELPTQIDVEMATAVTDVLKGFFSVIFNLNSNHSYRGKAAASFILPHHQSPSVFTTSLMNSNYQ